MILKNIYISGCLLDKAVEISSDDKEMVFKNLDEVRTVNCNATGIKPPVSFLFVSSQMPHHNKVNSSVAENFASFELKLESKRNVSIVCLARNENDVDFISSDIIKYICEYSLKYFRVY